MEIVYDPLFLTQLRDNKTYDKELVEKEFPKLQQAVEVHGYRGASKKKHNGIVPIRPQDKGLPMERSRACETWISTRRLYGQEQGIHFRTC